MLRLMTAILLLLASGCATVPSSLSGFCAGIDPVVDAHADALIETQDERVLVTGERLIRGVDAACF